MSWLPGISQAKSVFQLITGDVDGAKETQKQFFQQCPVVSQSVALVQLIADDKEGAKETWNKGCSTINQVVNSTPGVGHLKSGIHKICGDDEGAAQAFKSANRSAAVAAGGVGGFFAGGPVGAAAGGMYAGLVVDTVTTVVNLEPSGSLHTFERITQEKHAAGAIFDFVTGVALDGAAGYSAGQITGKVVGKINKNAAMSKIDVIEANKLNLNDAQYQAQYDAAYAQYKYGESLQGIKYDYAKDGSIIQSKTSVKPITSINEANDEKLASNQLKIAVISENQVFVEILLTLLRHEFKNFEKLLKDQKLEFDLEKLNNLQKLKDFLIENGVIKNYHFLKQKFGNYLVKQSPITRTLAIYWIELNQELKNVLEHEKNDVKNKKVSQKGEHVINNGVIRLYNKIIDEFLNVKLHKNFSEIEDQLSYLSQLKKDYNNDKIHSGFISIENKVAIKNVMIWKHEEPYFDANALMYGFFIENLMQSSVNHMIELWDCKEKGSFFTRHVKLCTEEIRSQEVFVDKIAYYGWINQGGNQRTYNKAKIEVDYMFDKLFDKLKFWVLELKNVPSLSHY